MSFVEDIWSWLCPPGFLEKSWLFQESLLQSMANTSYGSAELEACRDESPSLILKLIAVASILVAGVVGVAIPLVGKNRSFLRTDGSLFVAAKAFAAGVILATGFVHTLPGGSAALNDPCLLRCLCVSLCLNPTQQQQEYSWPAILFDVHPQRAFHFRRQFRTSPIPNNFLKGVKWSPDGSCFLTSSEDNTLRVFALPDYGSENANGCSVAADEDSYAANLVVNEGGSVYDFCWYPYMSASDPQTGQIQQQSCDSPTKRMVF